jgi:2-alkenal reductase
VTPAVAKALSLTVERGVLLQLVIPDGPAGKAALRGSDGSGSGADIVLALDGLEVRDMDDLIVYLARTTVGQTVTLTILRDGKQQDIEVTLEEWPHPEERDPEDS